MEPTFPNPFDKFLYERNKMQDKRIRQLERMIKRLQRELQTLKRRKGKI